MCKQMPHKLTAHTHCRYGTKPSLTFNVAQADLYAEFVACSLFHPLHHLSSALPGQLLPVVVAGLEPQ